MTIDPTMKQERQPSKLVATLKQLDQYKMIRQQKNLENNGTEQQDAVEHNSTATNKSQQDEIEKEKLRKVIVPRIYHIFFQYLSPCGQNPISHFELATKSLIVR